MALNLKGVQASRDAYGTARHLEHIQAPFVATGVANAEELATAYLREAADIYELPSAWLGALGTRVDTRNPVSDSSESRSADEVALAHVKSTLGTTVVSFVQLRHGLPVWEAGVSVVVQSDPLRVTSSQSTVHRNVGTAAPEPRAKFAPKSIDPKTLAKLLHLTSGSEPRINHVRPLVYRYDPKQRFDPESLGSDEPKKRRSDPGLSGGVPRLPLPDVEGFEAGEHYVATEVLFTWALTGMGPLNWRAFIDAATGAVLYLRAFVAHVTGSVFMRDPLTTTGGTLPASPLTVLNPIRTYVALQGITPPVPPAPFKLEGKYVKVEDVSAPAAAPPQTPDGVFVYDANTDDFSAVNAYYHCHELFQFMEDTGFDVFAFFDGTAANPGFPVPVDHRALGNTVNAQGPGNIFGDGSNGFRFALAQLGTTVGIADDPRVVAHEFCHALLWDSVHSPNFGFAHSAGDSLAAIFGDPGSLAPDRFLTFPWIAAGSAWANERRHDRAVGAGWGWGGVSDLGGYLSEQILATTLFRLYRAAGGDSGLTDPTARLLAQRATARWIAYLIIRGIGSLGTAPITPTPEPDVFATALMNADAGTLMLEGKPGGMLHKVVRWAFEKQGLYQPPGAPIPVASPGAPPVVDVYIDDGRGGEYLPYLDDVSGSPEIWNRLGNAPSTSPIEHEAPVLGKTNYLFVRVKNRGTEGATDVVVRGYRARPGSARVWPADWTPLTTASVTLPVTVPSGGSAIAGPFSWTPHHAGEEIVLMSVSATGDLSNIDPASALPSAAGPTPDELAVRLDNNLAERRFAPVPNPDPCAVDIPEIDPCCVSPCDPPWEPNEECIVWYEERLFRIPVRSQTVEVTGIIAAALATGPFIELRVTYEHRLCLLGKQHGPLLFTTTLLPGETIRLYHSDRYRRITSTQQRFSVQTTFVQFLSEVHQARVTNSIDTLNQRIAKSSGSESAGGGFFFGLFGGGGGISSSSSVSSLSQLAIHATASQFHQSVQQASQLTRAERSLVISTFEQKDTEDVTIRTLHNANDCRAVTYFVRQVLDLYAVSTRVIAIDYRVVAPGSPSEWHSIDDLDGLPAVIRNQIIALVALLPKIGQVVKQPRPISVPTDGAVYDPELAHCSSCEPERVAADAIRLEKEKAEALKACLEARQLELEIERRRRLLDDGRLDPFEPPALSPAPGPADEG